MEHTPIRWEIRGQDIYGDGMFIAQWSGTIKHARLIAAAPELLEACIIAKDTIGWQDNPSPELVQAFKILKQAIAKVEG